MGLNVSNPDYSKSTLVFLQPGAGDFTKESWNQNEHEMQRSIYYSGMTPRISDLASIDAIPTRREVSKETLETDLVENHIKVYSDELEEDIVLLFPSPRKYPVDLTITKITKWKLRLVGTEDLL